MKNCIRHSLLTFAVLSPLMVSSCGEDPRTVIVNPTPGTTVVVNPDGTTKTCPAGVTTC